MQICYSVRSKGKGDAVNAILGDLDWKIFFAAQIFLCRHMVGDIKDQFYNYFS